MDLVWVASASLRLGENEKSCIYYSSMCLGALVAKKNINERKQP